MKNNETTETITAVTAPNYPAHPLVNPNNQAKIVGLVVAPFTFSHESFGERFYSTYVSSCRKSNVEDIVPVLVSERLIYKYLNEEISLLDKMVEVCGEFRSFNSYDGTHSRLILFVFAKSFEVLENDSISLDYYSCSRNEVLFYGYICKNPIYRTTPNGREVADVLLAIHRNVGKSDYIPCVCWNRTAKYISTLPLGTPLELKGRIQSRPYKKKITETEVEDRVAYEVSVSFVKVHEQENIQEEIQEEPKSLSIKSNNN